MDKIKNDDYYIDKILESIGIIEKVYNGKTIIDLENDIYINNTVLFQLIIIAEYARRISDEYKNNKNSIPWHKINGLRNIAVHNYDRVRYDVIDDTIKEDLQILKKELSKWNTM